MLATCSLVNGIVGGEVSFWVFVVTSELQLVVRMVARILPGRAIFRIFDN